MKTLCCARGWAVVLMMFGIISAAASESHESTVEDLLSRMTMEEKLTVLAGAGYMDTLGVSRLGIAPLRLTDGPVGVRWGKSTCFPAAIAMAASWNTSLVERAGQGLAEEALAKGRNVLLGPCVNIQRTPLNGRNFESFGEDPYLAARMGCAYIRGVQGQGVAACVKHLACNNQEMGRFTVSVEVDERALREIYLPAFEVAVRDAGVWTVMTGHNKVNGSYCSESDFLLRHILKDEWGFDGLVMSDWGGVHSMIPAALAGLDLEMPGPGVYFGQGMAGVVERGEVPAAVVDDKVRRFLRTTMRVQQAPPNTSAPGLDHAALTREIAQEAIVLLKNRRSLLPLNRKETQSIAVIGPSAAAPRSGGGGSSHVEPQRVVTPIEGLRAAAGNLSIRFAQGAFLASEYGPIDPLLLSHGLGQHEAPGLRVEYFGNTRLEGEPVAVGTNAGVSFNWENHAPVAGLDPDRFSVRWTGRLRAPATGPVRLGLTGDDGIRLFIDDVLVIDHWGDHGASTRIETIDMEQGRTYGVRVEYYESGGSASARFGWLLEGNLKEAAARLAATSDVAIVFAGLSEESEGEDVDRVNMDLPRPQAELIRAVCAANSNTVVVLINGGLVAIDDWADGVDAIVEAWYPGEEGGLAIADILFGDVNPSGRLPVSWPRRLEDHPSHTNYPGDGRIVSYAEGMAVGYRYFDTAPCAPLYPFGHGLSYTEFTYTDLSVPAEATCSGFPVRASVTVSNAGMRAGQEVVQLYVRDVVSRLPRPFKELKGFRKVHLEPGASCRVDFDLEERAFAFFDPEAGAWTTEPGAFEIMAGRSAGDIRAAQTVHISESVAP